MVGLVYLSRQDFLEATHACSPFPVSWCRYEYNHFECNKHWPSSKKCTPVTCIVREITKSSSSFTATNISSNLIWFLQLHNTMNMRSIFATKLVAFLSQRENNIWFFSYHLSTCNVRKMVLVRFMQNIDMCLLYKSHQIARLVSYLINHFSKWMFTV